MRSLSSTLTQAQKDMGTILWKAVLTSGTASYTYGVDTSNLLLKIAHNEQPSSQIAKLTIDNSDGTLTSLSLEGYQCKISYGYTTSAGDEYSDTAPLKIKGQQFISSGGVLQCILDGYGLPDQLKDDHASAAYNPTSSDTATVQSLIAAIGGATLAPYSHCASITVTVDSSDGLYTTFSPADYFHIAIGDNRLDKIKELLSYTKCVMKAGSSGSLHILNPTVAGTAYDYQYNDTVLSTNHTFFSKVYRNRLVLPNEIYIISSPDHSPSYAGSAQDTTSNALLPKRDYKVMRLTSNAQAGSIATAIIQKLQTDHQKGNGFVPMNVGQEIHDYIQITDAREGDNRVGNIGYITRNCDMVGKGFPFGMGFSFGDVSMGGSIGIMMTSDKGTTTPPSYVTYADLQSVYDQLQGNVDAIVDYITMMQDTVPKWHVTQQMIIPVI